GSRTKMISDPSAVQVGASALRVTNVGLLPSERIVYSESPRTNAGRRPSGDHGCCDGVEPLLVQHEPGAGAVPPADPEPADAGNRDAPTVGREVRVEDRIRDPGNVAGRVRSRRDERDGLA